MRLIPMSELSDEQWAADWQLTYSPELAPVMGVEPTTLEHKPDLVTFYANLSAANEAGLFQAWGIIRHEQYAGHVVLDKTISGEWELGVALTPEHRGFGVGVRATLKALEWAFTEDDAEFVTAYTSQPEVAFMLKKMGWRKFLNLWLLDARTWQERWGSRLEAQ